MSEQRMQATGGCRCDTNPVRYEYTRAPFEVHYCLCTDCTDIRGGGMAPIAVVRRDPFPDHVLVHVPTLDRESQVGGEPDRWVFTDSKHPLLAIPDDGLPRHPGWAPTPTAVP